MADTKVLVLVGSLRGASLNRQLAEVAVESAPDGVTVRVADGLGDLPFYNEDLDNESVPAAVVALRQIAGDADARAEARQSLLEAVLSATERLVVIRDGHDVRTNQQVPRAVVVAELAEAIGATVTEAARAEVLGRLEVHHPRQPFDERCFVAAGTDTDTDADRPWSFDPGALAGLTALKGLTTMLFYALPELGIRINPFPAAVIAFSLNVGGYAAEIIRSVVNLGHALHMTTTAEGVETQEQRHFFEAAGCHQMQGYLFGRPDTADAIADRLARQHRAVA